MFTCYKVARTGRIGKGLKKKATEQYGVIVRYLRGAMEVLKKPECQLLLDFAEIEKNHCERLHREIQNRLATERVGA